MRWIPSPVPTATTAVTGTLSAGDGGATGRRRRGFAHPAFLLDLFGQVGDPDLARTPGVEGRFNRGADVVGVDVAIPQPVPADDDDRVPETGPHVLEGRDELVLGREEVHHLVARRRPAAVLRPADAAAAAGTGPAETSWATSSGNSSASGIGRPSTTLSRAS